MRRPWFGPCPYCDERVVFGMHITSWLIGITTLVPFLIYWVVVH